MIRILCQLFPDNICILRPETQSNAAAMLKVTKRGVSIGLGLLLGLSVAASAQDKALPPQGRSDLEAFLWPVGRDVQRRDQRGAALEAEALRDRLVVVAFVSADCTITCAVRTLDLDKLEQALPGPLRERVTILCLDTDPVRDDGLRLRGFADGLVGGTTRLRFLDSDAATTAQQAKALRYPASALPEPPPTVLVFDRRGTMAMVYGGDPIDAARLQRDLTLLETFEDGVGHPPRASAQDRS